MRTYNYYDYLARVSALCGIDSSTLTTQELAAYSGYAHKNVRVAWNAFQWPGACLVEQRTPVSGLVAWEQTGQTAIGEVFGVYETSPLLFTAPRRLRYTLDVSGVRIVESSVPTTVWVRFRRLAPELSGTAYANGSYSAGSVVYHPTTGSLNYYKASAAVTSGQTPGVHASWVLQSIPDYCFEYVIHASFSDWLRSDGQTDKANAELALADAFLAEEIDLYERQQGHVTPITFSTHITSRG
jgi:hypothetical protein